MWGNHYSCKPKSMIFNCRMMCMSNTLSFTAVGILVACGVAPLQGIGLRLTAYYRSAEGACQLGLNVQ